MLRAQPALYVTERASTDSVCSCSNAAPLTCRRRLERSPSWAHIRCLPNPQAITCDVLLRCYVVALLSTRSARVMTVCCKYKH